MNGTPTPEELKKREEERKRMEKTKYLVRFKLLSVLQGRKQDKSQQEAHELQMLLIGIILADNREKFLTARPDRRGNIRFNLFPFQTSLGAETSLDAKHYVLTVDKDGNIFPQVDDEVRGILLGIVADILPKNETHVLIEKIPEVPTPSSSSEGEASSDTEERSDPEYLAFRAELQPIFDCLNSYRFATKEK